MGPRGGGVEGCFGSVGALRKVQGDGGGFGEVVEGGVGIRSGWMACKGEEPGCSPRVGHPRAFLAGVTRFWGRAGMASRRGMWGWQADGGSNWPTFFGHRMITLVHHVYCGKA